MALVIGGAWAVPGPGRCLCALVACAGGLWPGCWVLGAGVLGLINGLGGDRWPDRCGVACPSGVPWCLICGLICPGGGLIGGLPALMPAHQGNHIILQIITKKPWHSDNICQIY